MDLTQPFVLFTDGGSRGNPGNAACAAVLFDAQGKLHDFDTKHLGIGTNNFAEYSGLILGLKLAAKNGVKSITANLDSELVVKQMKGEYKVKNADIAKIKAKVDQLLPEFDKIMFVYVPRAQNKFADKLLNLTLDNANNL